MNTTEPGIKSNSSSGSRWFLLPIVLLGFLLSMLAVLITVSVGDPSFAVEPDYYRKATDWDDTMRQAAVNRELGWRGEAAFEAGTLPREAVLVVRLLEADGTPLAGAGVVAEVFHNARAAKIYELALLEADRGVYRAAFGSTRPGLWEVRLRVHRDGTLFTESQRVDMPYRLPRAAGGVNAVAPQEAP